MILNKIEGGVRLKKKISIFCILILILGIGTLVIFNQKSEETVETEKEIEEPISYESDSEDYVNPFGYTVGKERLEDVHFLNYIHKMSHQKVEAEDKWDYFRITDERIEWLYDALVQTQEDLEHESFYRDILDRWIVGDFSRVDKDHNAVWEIQGGTYGEATGILSTEEEKEFIESTPELTPIGGGNN